VGVGVLVDVKVAITFFAVSIVTTHTPVPEHPLPLQPVKVELVPLVAVNVTTVL
jgi:hypothetical protein